MTTKKKTPAKKSKKKVAKKKATKSRAIPKKKTIVNSDISFVIKDSPKKTTKKKAKKKAGRLPKWKEEYLPIIKNLFTAGRTTVDVCVALGISEKTFYNWKDNYFSEEILQSIGDWKKNADEKVMSSLFRRATGTLIVEDKAFMTKGGVIKTVKIVKEVVGDVNAQRYWLNNRDKKNWRDKNEAPDKSNNNRDRSFGFTFNEEAEEL